jgi:GNAT superfamily N-acetyltransferase
MSDHIVNKFLSMGDLHLEWRGINHSDVAAALAIFDSNVPEYFTMAERSSFADFLVQLPGPYFVVEAPGEGVVACGGYAAVEPQRRGDLCWGMVRRDLHGCGVGRYLTTQRIEALRADARVGHVILNTSHLTQAFYSRLGFATTTVTENGIGPGLHRFDMRLDFGPG